MLSSMGKGSRAWNRWRRERQRKVKARKKKQAQERAATRAAAKS
jgi:hypothetical protein